MQCQLYALVMEGSMLYRKPLGLVDLDFAKRSKIEAHLVRAPNEEHHCQIGKGDEEGRFGKVAASPNLPNLTVRGIDVLIIGAGPTGLFMAAEVARHGLSCRLIEKTLVPSEKSRALVIQPRTLEIFQHVGIIEPFLKEGRAVKSMHLMSLDKELAHLHFSELDTAFPFVLSLEQSKTEQILTQVALSRGVTLERGVEFLDLQKTKEGARITCNHIQKGVEEIIEARFVVGCDGAHSAVRKTLQIPFKGKAFPSLFSLADVKLEWERPPGEFFVFLNPEGIRGAVPMTGENRYRLVFPRKKGESELTLQGIQERTGPQARVSDPLWMAHFQIHTRLVKTYQSGCVFLAGDAAHVHSPIGGQGMNSGLQDAFNLGWKLATRDPSVIKTYTVERRSWAKKLLRATLFATRLVALQNPLLIAIRNRGIRFLLPRIEKKLVSTLAQLRIQYPKSRVVKTGGGMRAPNVPVGKSDLYTLMRGSTKPHLLLFGVTASPLYLEAVVVPMDHKEAWERYGIKSKAICLIRPDLYIETIAD
jgi:2-polyprenyl-6-methoxyphenol hydroxylase-like FAD-dependent oxidoreductase